MHKLLSFFTILLLVSGLSFSVVAMEEKAELPAVININAADAQALTELKGVGPKLAQDIVAWREANGDFSSMDQLLEVKGIGPKFLAKNKSRITLK
ncbi:MAG: hypothetical protein AseanaTS_21590 [Candidatus Pelagadaptatus aseana]|uniref:ComEA family DNA-binding protein n=1 Tax=Candidatus Pelagadaptatus aseana TaxID=3120508 RepID=UPI0039B26DA7